MQDIEYGAVLVDRPSEVVARTTDADEHRVQMPLVAGAGPAPPERGGERPPEAQALGPNVLVTDPDAPLRQNQRALAPAQA